MLNQVTKVLVALGRLCKALQDNPGGAQALVSLAGMALAAFAIAFGMHVGT